MQKNFSYPLIVDEITAAEKKIQFNGNAGRTR